MVIENDFFMKLALREAWKYQGLTYPNPAVGCVVVAQSGAILAVEAHKKAGAPHAEVEALKAAYYKLTCDETILNLTNSADIHTHLLQNHNNCFHGATVFTTLEPCSHIGKTPSCAHLLSKLGIKKLFLGSKDSHEIASGGSQIVKNTGVEVQEHLMEKECDALLKPFKLSQEKQFVFFKWAQRLNGSVDSGVISSQSSRELVHAMRDACDLLVIGGNTVRIDRPTLDARLVDGKAPDVLILSRGKEFDKTIPLFSVPKREVIIADNFDAISGYKNIMIEGGREMFTLSKDFVDYYLCFVSPQMGGEVGFGGVHERFEILNIAQDAQDIIMWMKRDK